MTDPSGNIEFCLPSNLNVPRGEASQPLEQPVEHCNKKQLTKETHPVSETGLAKLNKQFLSELYGHSKRKTLDVQTHYKPTETFQYTHFSSSHPLSVKKGFITGETSRLLRTNSVKEIFELRKLEFLTCLLERGYPRELAENILAEVKFSSRNEALQKFCLSSRLSIQLRLT